jgi:hypothetical protein
LFRSEFFFRTTRELEYLFFLSGKTRIFFPEFNIRLYGKTLNQIIFFFLHQNQNIFFSNIGNQKINGRSLKRIGKNHSKLNRLTIFHTYVLSNFNFCPLSWHFCSETNTKKIEKIQERALRFVYQDYEASYENLLIKAKCQHSISGE